MDTRLYIYAPKSGSDFLLRFGLPEQAMGWSPLRFGTGGIYIIIHIEDNPTIFTNSHCSVYLY